MGKAEMLKSFSVCRKQETSVPCRKSLRDLLASMLARGGGRRRKLLKECGPQSML